MNDEFRKMVTGAFDEVFESTKQKPTKSDWEQNADKLQQKEQQELEQPIRQSNIFQQ